MVESRCKGWSDPDYKKRLLADPASVFKQEGMPVSDSLKLKVIEEKRDEIVVVLPKMPEEGPKVENLEERLAATLWT